METWAQEIDIDFLLSPGGHFVPIVLATSIFERKTHALVPVSSGKPNQRPYIFSILHCKLSLGRPRRRTPRSHCFSILQSTQFVKHLPPKAKKHRTNAGKLAVGNQGKMGVHFLVRNKMDAKSARTFWVLSKIDVKLASNFLPMDLKSQDPGGRDRC